MKTCCHCHKEVDENIIYCIHCGFFADEQKNITKKKKFNKEVEPINDNNHVKNILTGVSAIILYFVMMFGQTLPFELLNIDINLLSFEFKIVYSFVWELVTMIILLLLYFDPLKKMFKDFRKNFRHYFKNYYYYWFIMLGLMMASNLVINSIAGLETAPNEQNIDNLFQIAPIYIYFSAVIYAPIVEELVFRLSIRKLCKNNWLFIAISGLVFGLIHVIGSEHLIEYLYIIPYAIPGFIFAYVLVKSDNIFNTMGLHFFHNAIMMTLQIMMYLFM